LDLIRDEEKCFQLHRNISGLGFANAADAIASVIIDLVK